MPICNTATHLKFLKQKLTNLKPGTGEMGFVLVMKGSRDAVLHVDRKATVLAIKNPIMAHQTFKKTRAFRIQADDAFWSDVSRLVSITGTVQDVSGTLMFHKHSGQGKEADFDKGVKVFKKVLKKSCTFGLIEETLSDADRAAKTAGEDAEKRSVSGLIHAFQDRIENPYIPSTAWKDNFFTIFGSVENLAKIIDFGKRAVEANMMYDSQLASLSDLYNEVKDWNNGIDGVQGAMREVMTGVPVFLQQERAGYQTMARELDGMLTVEAARPDTEPDVQGLTETGDLTRQMDAMEDFLEEVLTDDQYDMIEGIEPDGADAKRAEPEDSKTSEADYGPDPVEEYDELEMLDQLLDLASLNELGDLAESIADEEVEVKANLSEAMESAQSLIRSRKSKGFWGSGAKLINLAQWVTRCDEGHFWFAENTNHFADGKPILLVSTDGNFPHFEDAQRALEGSAVMGRFQKKRKQHAIAFRCTNGSTTQAALRDVLRRMGVAMTAYIVNSLDSETVGEGAAAVTTTLTDRIVEAQEDERIAPQLEQIVTSDQRVCWKNIITDNQILAVYYQFMLQEKNQESLEFYLSVIKKTIPGFTPVTHPKKIYNRYILSQKTEIGVTAKDENKEVNISSEGRKRLFDIFSAEDFSEAVAEAQEEQDAFFVQQESNEVYMGQPLVGDLAVFSSAAREVLNMIRSDTIARFLDSRVLKTALQNDATLAARFTATT